MATEGLKAAADTTKQFITLSTGIIALTVTFAKEFKPANSDLSVPTSLQLAWLGYGICVVFGVWTLMAITGSLNAQDLGQSGSNANDFNIRFPSSIMVLSFLMAIGLTIWSGSFVVR